MNILDKVPDFNKGHYITNQNHALSGHFLKIAIDILVLCDLLNQMGRISSSLYLEDHPS